MPTTPIHWIISIGGYYAVSQFTNVEFTLINVLILASAELIDLDHLFSRPIYIKNRSSFKTHFLHIHWKYVVMAALIMMLFYPMIFLGIGLITHLLTDYIYQKYFLKL